MEVPGRSEREVAREQLEEFVGRIFREEIHAKRVASLINGVDGVLHAATLGIRASGQGLAAAQGLVPKHAIKQVDRLLSNTEVDRESLFRCWVRFVVAERAEIVVTRRGARARSSTSTGRSWKTRISRSWCSARRRGTGAAPRCCGRRCGAPR